MVFIQPVITCQFDAVVSEHCVCRSWWITRSSSVALLLH